MDRFHNSCKLFMNWRYFHLFIQSNKANINVNRINTVKNKSSNITQTSIARFYCHFGFYNGGGYSVRTAVPTGRRAMHTGDRPLHGAHDIRLFDRLFGLTGGAEWAVRSAAIRFDQRCRRGGAQCALTITNHHSL
jgi:hypothetical protein